MTRSKTLIVSGLTVLLLGGVAFANPEADTDNNGVISKSEFLAHAQAKFDRADQNRDGYISRSEQDNARASHSAERQAKHFDRFDANGDGVITKDEFASTAEAHKDGRRERRKEFREKRDSTDRQDRMERRKAFKERRAEHGGKDRWERVDINGDDLISAQEYMSGAEKMFEFLDADGDGQLSKGEGRKRKKKRGFRRGR